MVKSQYDTKYPNFGRPQKMIKCRHGKYQQKRLWKYTIGQPRKKDRPAQRKQLTYKKVKFFSKDDKNRLYFEAKDLRYTMAKRIKLRQYCHREL